MLDHVVVGPGASQAPASSSSSVAQPSARRRHRPTDTIDTTSTTVLVPRDHSQRRRTPGPCRQLKTAKVTRVTNSRISIGYDERHRAAPTAELHSSLAHDIGHVTNYNLEDLDEESLTYVNRLFAERYKQWKSDLHHHFQAYDDPQVALQEGCPKELEGREDSWEWLCAHFQAPEFANKAQVNKGNRKKKTLLHHSGSRPFSYRMDARRREGSKFPEIDVFGDVYVRPGNELAESLHTTMVERSQLVLQESASQLPPETPIESVAPPQDAGFQILTETLDQTLGRRPGTYCRGMGNARRREPRPRSSVQSSRQVTALTAHMVTLENKLSAILHSLAQSGIPVPHFDEPTPSPSLPSISPRPLPRLTPRPLTRILATTRFARRHHFVAQTRV
ncbi:Ankyrin repeat family protein [Prunus dulcis]|uniref:Ankyrin repeat family protein n=1 Tax=Prunus dulcis TaxID=3755 RepID=A0A4Y1RTY0_PRUDU|nr:Ankyrin repeat family protein [Prunus dulcis]